MQSENFIAWVLAGVGTVIATLSTAIAKLYHAQVGGYQKREAAYEGEIAKLREAVQHCDKEHTQTKIELAEIKTRLAIVEGKINQ